MMMGTRKNLKQQIAAKEPEIKQKQAEVGALRSEDKEAERKLDTRRKIILGGAMMSYAKMDRECRELVQKVARIKIVRPEDQAIMRDFLFGDAPEAGSPDRPENPCPTVPARPDPS
jgi:hypothetical protein